MLYTLQLLLIPTTSLSSTQQKIKRYWVQNLWHIPYLLSPKFSDLTKSFVVFKPALHNFWAYGKIDVFKSWLVKKTPYLLTLKFISLARLIKTSWGDKGVAILYVNLYVKVCKNHQDTSTSTVRPKLQFYKKVPSLSELFSIS